VNEKRKYLSVKEKQFLEIVATWKKDTMFQSSVSIIHADKSAKEIMDIANTDLDFYLPVIIGDLEESSWIGWMMVLQVLTGCNPIPIHHLGYVQQMTEDWTMWYQYFYRKQPKINSNED